MPHSMNVRLPVLCRLTGCFLLCVAAISAHGAALGELVVQSRLGQPLQAEIRLVAVTPRESTELLAKLASPEAFKRANVPYDPVAASLKFGVMQRDGDYFVTISSEQAMENLTISVLLELSSESSRLMREYTLFIDPFEPGGQINSPKPQGKGVLAEASDDSALFRVTGSALPESPFVPQTAKADEQIPEKVAYTIRAEDFLGGIASRFKADDVSVYQMMVAIFRTNPAAFVGNNINRMRVGRILIIPDEVTVRNISQSEARLLVIEQGKAYRGGVLVGPDDNQWRPYPQ